MENVTTTSAPDVPSNYFSSNLQKGIALNAKIVLFQHNPVISVNGSASFPEAYIPNYIRSVNGYSVQINGTTRFDFDCSSDNIMLLTDFSYSGIFQTSQEETKISMVYWELTAIPWLSILTSPSFQVFTILLLLIVTIVLYFMHFKARKRRS
jgi:hypothetical protein